jgi:hypothetical protein
LSRKTWERKARVLMQISISIVLLLAGMVILFAPNGLLHSAVSEGTQKLAAGWIGAVIGYWLGPSS